MKEEKEEEVAILRRLVKRFGGCALTVPAEGGDSWGWRSLRLKQAVTDEFKLAGLKTPWEKV